MAKEIELTQGYKAIVDDDMYDELIKYKWCAHKMIRNGTVYATRLERMHFSVVGYPNKGMVVDHINGNGLDNRRENLRIITNQNNIRCQGINRNNTSGYRGVSWHKGKQRWEAKIRVNGHRLSLGRYKTAEEAARAYDAVAREYFKEFAKPNFPD
jgi:hypothetical protein